MLRSPLAMKFLLLGIAVWAAVAGIMHLTENQVSSPEKVLALVSTTPWYNNAGVSATERRKHIDEVIRNLNLLDFQQRHTMRDDGQEQLDHFSKTLTDDEKLYFVDQTIEKHFENVMKGLNAMDAEQRKQMVSRMRREMAQRRGNDDEGQRLREQDREAFDRMVDKGLESYFRDATADTKMDLAPVLEDMQARLQGARF
jgi:hypothetical protein